jgi:uncharacterized protein (TIGR02996 family)
VTDRDTLFANVLEDPTDDTARLVLADWLEENDEGDFGQFLRAGVLAAQFQDRDQLDDPAYYELLRTIALVTTAGAPARWLAELGIGPSPPAPGAWVWDNAGDRVTVRIGAALGVFARGLLTELEVRLGEWYALAAPALEVWPITCVRASDVPGLSFEVERLDRGWRLTGRVRLPRRNVPLTGHALPSAMAPGAVLAQSPGEWGADQFFADRPALVAGAARECAALVADLMDAAGNRWPRPPRKRR